MCMHQQIPHLIVDSTHCMQETTINWHQMHTSHCFFITDYWLYDHKPIRKIPSWMVSGISQPVITKYKNKLFYRTSLQWKGRRKRSHKSDVDVKCAYILLLYSYINREEEEGNGSNHHATTSTSLLLTKRMLPSYW